MSCHVPPKNLRPSSAGFFLVLLTCLSLVTVLSACQQFAASKPIAATFSPPAISVSPPLPSITALPSLTLTPSSSPTRPFSPTAPPSATATISPPPSVTPTYAILRGKVLVRSNCRYGPGADYLYYVGLRPGTTMNVIGRNDLGTWVLIQGAGDDRYCWIKADLMEIDGDVLSVQPTVVPLPLSPYYRPPTGVSAARDGDQVTIRWHGFRLRPGDETASPPFLLEAWVCQDGKLLFIPIGSYGFSLTLVDESGCAQPSHALLYIVEKHGYTRGTEVPWPPHQ